MVSEYDEARIDGVSYDSSRYALIEGIPNERDELAEREWLLLELVLHGIDHAPADGLRP